MMRTWMRGWIAGLVAGLCAWGVVGEEKGQRLDIGEFHARRLDPAPVIDGKVAPGEWDRALASSGLIAPFDHALQEAETTMRFGFDDRNFYFLFECVRGNQEWKLWKKSRNNDDYDFGEPTVEVWITPPALVPETYQNIINTFPAVYDQQFIPNRGYASLGWKADWTLGVSESETNYTVEASVPIRSFGIEAVKSGDVWRFLFCRNCLGAKPRSQASWSITQGFSEIPQHPRVHLIDDSAVVQLLGVTSIFTGHYRFPMAVVAPAKTGADIDVVLRFHKEKSLGDGDVIVKQSFPLKAGTRREFVFEGNVPEGWKEGNFTILATTQDGAPVFRQQFPFAVSGFTPMAPAKPENARPVEDLALKVMYGPESNLLLCKADIFDMASRDSVASGTIKVMDVASGRVMKQASLSPFHKYYASGHVSMEGVQIPEKDLRKLNAARKEIQETVAANESLARKGQSLKPVPEMPTVTPLKVAVEVSLADKDGKVLATNRAETALVRLVTPWQNAGVGVTDKVIPPWTPVTYEGGKVGVWNRQMQVDGLGLAKSLRNGTVGQLKQAMRLVAIVDGKPVEVRSSAPALDRLVEASATMKGTGGGAGLALKAETTVEFDGFTLVRMTVAPADPAAPAKIDGLYLEIVLPEEEATHYCTTAGGWAAVNDETPAYWSSQQTAAGTLIGDFVPYIWLSNTDRGFLWFADNDKGWIVDSDKSKPTQELIRKDGTVTLRIHFVELPVDLKEPTTVTYGYQAFPSRPLPEGWRMILCAGGAPVPDTKSTYFWFDGDWAVLWPYYCSPYPWNMAKSEEHFGRFPVDSSHRPCVGSIAHSIGRYRDYEGNTFDELGVDWGSTPGDLGNANVTQSRGPVDFRLYYYQRWVREARFRGLYIDENYLSAEDNWLTGGAYLRPDFRVQQGYSYLGLRDYFKRMMIMFHQNHTPRPNLWMHITAGAAYHSWFGDVYFEGENVEPTDLNFDYLEVLPAGRMRSIGSAVCSGAAMTMMCQSVRHATAWEPKHTHQFVGWVMAHDILPEQVRYYPVLGQEARLYRPDVKFQGYWKADNPVRARTEGCVASIHKVPGRTLAWVVNTGRRDAQVEVAVDWAKLGMDSRQCVGLNAETGALIPLTGKGFTVPVLMRDFVAVHLVERKILTGAETLVATFDGNRRADEAYGCDAIVAGGRVPEGRMPGLRDGVKGQALEVVGSVVVWPRLHLTDSEGRVRFHALLSDAKSGSVLQLGPLAIRLVGGKEPGVTLEYKADPKARETNVVRGPVPGAGWHQFDLGWAQGKAHLWVDGATVGEVAIGAIGIAHGLGPAMEGGAKLEIGGSGLVAAIDELRCYRSVE